LLGLELGRQEAPCVHGDGEHDAGGHDDAATAGVGDGLRERGPEQALACVDLAPGRRGADGRAEDDLNKAEKTKTNRVR
jgi:hypothetical protein